MRRSFRDPGKKLVLVIDDSIMTLKMCQGALEDLGVYVEAFPMPAAGVVATTSLAEELKMGEDQTPSLILMDLNMPGASGAEVTQSFKERWGIDIPIYLFSDTSEEELAQKAEEAGADGYICKGWGLERMCARVSEILGISKP